jgi:D-arginine dehydrogenase
VNATGAWINSFIEIENGIHRVAAQPFARHLFAVIGWDADFMPAPNCGFYWDEVRNFYMRKWEQDARLVSICDQAPANPDSFSPDGSAKERLAEILCKVFPEMAANLRIATSWHCFRTYTEDQMPIWGSDPNVEQLFWLAAFGGYGMSTSFAAAQDAARLISGEDIQIGAAFSPGRLPALEPVPK